MIPEHEDRKSDRLFVYPICSSGQSDTYFRVYIVRCLPGGVAPSHSHPIEEFVYLAEGSFRDKITPKKTVVESPYHQKIGEWTTHDKKEEVICQTSSDRANFFPYDHKVASIEGCLLIVVNRSPQ